MAVCCILAALRKWYVVFLAYSCNCPVIVKRNVQRGAYVAFVKYSFDCFDHVLVFLLVALVYILLSLIFVTQRV